MKQCPKCSALFQSEFDFCMSDGTPLIPVSISQETMVQPGLGMSLASASDQKYCGGCGATNPLSNFVCDRCGRPFESIHDPRQQAAMPFSAFQPPGSTAGAAKYGGGKKGLSKNALVGVGAAVIGLVVVIGFVFLMTRAHPMEATFEKAILSGNLTGSDTSALAAYRKIKADGGQKDLISKYGDRIVSSVNSHSKNLIQTDYEIGNPNNRPQDWLDTAELLDLAAEASQGDAKLLAKAEFCRGRGEFLIGNYDAAVTHFEKAADLDRSWVLPKNGLGQAHISRKDYKTARKWLLTAIDLEPNWAPPHNNIGKSYFLQKRYADAKPYLEKAIELSPQWAVPKAWLGSASEQLQDYYTAESALEAVLAPGAVGTSEMDLDKIKKDLERVRRKKMESEYWNYLEGE